MPWVRGQTVAARRTVSGHASGTERCRSGRDTTHQEELYEAPAPLPTSLDSCVSCDLFPICTAAIAVELAEQGSGVLRCSLRQLLDKGFDPLPRGIFEGLGTT